ncbi:tetratricopeptide repeat protein [Mycolicibacterium houstonense]|uniref:tetratricopeptide repeat protein n=1 Tax=Mycolicibacterium houstonense TaxID=146021 RepID=UPI00082CB1DA|nr:tetratricopeptide repeat protein [Mycolicibacterium houstonense]
MTSMAERAAEKVRVLLDLDRNEEAAEAARAGLHSDPNNAELLGLLASALYEGGHAREARKWCERSLAVDPNQAWVHDIRARAILAGAGKPKEALESASAAVRLAHTRAYYRYTLTRAQLEAKQRKNAQSTAESIRTIAPASPLGPLSEAIVEIDRAKFFKINPVWAVVAVVLTRGLVLVFWAIAWLYMYVRRRGPLRRADAHLVEALRLNPGDAFTHRVAAEVARYRFRFIRAVDSTLASAAIDAHMVDATELARGIVRRTSVIAVITFVFWCVLLLSTLSLIPSAAVTALLGTALVIAAAAGVTWLYEEQTKRLPPGVLRLVRRRWGLPVTALVMAGWLSIVAGSNNPWGVAIPAGVGAAILLAGFCVLTARLVSARRGG